MWNSLVFKIDRLLEVTIFSLKLVDFPFSLFLIKQALETGNMKGTQGFLRKHWV